MKQLAASAIVLESRNLGERDRVVSFLTAEWGKKSGAARGARGKFSRFAGQLQPLARVHIAWFEKEGRDLVRISDASVERGFAAGDDLERLLVATYLADLVGAFAQENEDNGPLFRLLDLAATRLQEGLDPERVSRYVEYWTLRLGGIFPAPDACPRCGSPFPGGGTLVEHDSALVCRDCAGSVDAGRGAGRGDSHFGRTVLDVLRVADRLHLDDWAAIEVPASVLGDTERLCRRVRRAYLGNELRSYRVMRETLRAV